jgi:hypothetical protein
MNTSKIQIRYKFSKKSLVLKSTIIVLIFGVVALILTSPKSSTSAISGVKDKEEIDMSVFPNPVAENNPLYINLARGKSLREFRLFTLSGKLVYEQSLSTSKNLRINLDDESLSRGTYFYTVTNNSGKSAQGKLIID